MCDLNSSLHGRTEEAIGRSQPSMEWTPTTYERRLVGSSSRTMSTTNSTIGKINRLAMTKTIRKVLVISRDPSRLRREHVTLRHQPRAFLNNLLPQIRGTFKRCMFTRHCILPMSLTALKFFPIFHIEFRVG